ncbi:MAG: hypothetical protein ACT4NU_13370 [Chromatiales bacterium]
MIASPAPWCCAGDGSHAHPEANHACDKNDARGPAAHRGDDRGAIVLVAISSAVQAGELRYENVALTDDRESGTDKHQFSPDTPKIFLLATLADVPSGTKLKSVWVAEKTTVAPPDYEIDSAELTGGGDSNKVTFSLSRPDAGWPPGEYRVELFIDGQPAGSVRFTVTP